MDRHIDEETSLPKILIVEDDQSLAGLIADYLKTNGFEVSVEGRGDVAARRIAAESPDAVVLDINLPGLDGLTICREVRPDFDGIILVLTARGDEVDEVVSLELGADDYMAKPVRPRALLARLQMHLRRSESVPQSATSPGPIQVGSLVVDESRRCAALDDTELPLTTAEFDLLLLLAQNAGAIVSRNELCERLHGLKYDGQDRSIDLRVSRLRKKLGDDPANPQRIKSVRGVGYMLPVEP